MRTRGARVCWCFKRKFCAWRISPRNAPGESSWRPLFLNSGTSCSCTGYSKCNRGLHKATRPDKKCVMLVPVAAAQKILSATEDSFKHHCVGFVACWEDEGRWCLQSPAFVIRDKSWLYFILRKKAMKKSKREPRGRDLSSSLSRKLLHGLFQGKD